MSDTPVPVVEVRGLTSGYGTQPAIADITFSAGSGVLVGMLGANGSGKSTLLKAMVGLLPAWSGTVRFFGEPVERVRARIGYMPQAEHVDWTFPISVREVVEMGMGNRGLGIGRFRHRAAEPTGDALQRLGISALAHRQVGELSGGQQRRVLLARTIVRDPDILLLDEPTAGLDITAEEEFLDLIVALARAGKTVLVATHDIGCVARVFDYALCIKTSLVAYGPVHQTLTNDVLAETFGRHLIPAHGGAFAQPHISHEQR